METQETGLGLRTSRSSSILGAPYTNPSVHESCFTCLVIEDCDHDYLTFERLLSRTALPVRLKRCADGEEVMRLLAYLDSSSVEVHEVPAVIILDINLPGEYGGREILQAVRKHSRIRRTPVIVFSSSTNPVDIDCCHREGASAYHVKGFDLSSYRWVIESVAKFWSRDEKDVLMTGLGTLAPRPLAPVRAA